MKLSIGAALAGLSGVMVLVAGLQGGFSIASFSTIKSGIRVIVEERVPAFITIGTMNAGVGSVRNAQSAIINADAATLGPFRDKLAQANTNLVKSLDAYQEDLVDEADKKYFEEFKQKWAASQKSWQDIESLIQAGRLDEARALFVGASYAAYDAAKTSLQGAVDDMAADVQDEGAVTQEASSSAMTLNYASLTAALLGELGTCGH